MKIRNGFVSNSSSSAFVIKLNDLTMEQLQEIAESFPIHIVGNEIRVVYAETTDTMNNFFDTIGIPCDVIKWTNLI